MPFLGQNFFPSTDNGSFILHVRAKSGTRIEETAKLCDLIEQDIRKTVPPAEMDNILDNIGLPYSTLNTQHATSGLIGAGDADILVSLKEDHHPTANYVEKLRKNLPRDVSRSHVLLSAVRYRDADFELRTACADRYPVRGIGYCSKSQSREPGIERAAACSGLGGSAHPAAGRLSCSEC